MRLATFAAAATAAAALALALAWPAAAAAQSWQADLSVSYMTGSYGEEQTSSIVSVPLMIKRVFSRGEASVTIPFVAVEGPADAVLLDGTPQGGGAGPKKWTAGLGDVGLKGKFTAFDERGWLPGVDLAARLKLPTASDELGTGKADLGVGAELAHSLGRRNMLMVDTMYTFVGDPQGVDYRNRIAWDAGLAWMPEPGQTLALFYDYRSAVLAEKAAERSLMLYGSTRVNPAVRLYGMVEFGLSEAASDIGLTGGLKYSF